MSRSFVCGPVLHDLKLNGLLRFRGCQAGRRKISVRISDRLTHATRHDRTTPRSSVLVPIVPEQRLRVGSYLKFCSLNARSVRNKSADFVSYVESSGADILAVTETWLSEVDDACRAEITPPGYKLFDQIRSDRTGGGTALLIRENLHASRVDAGVRTSFEFSHWMVEFQSRKLKIIIIYRPPYSSNHPVTTSVFFADFSSFLEGIIMSSVPLLIAGDFNIHVDVPGIADSVCLKELLESMGLRQHVKVPTQESGHTLDLIITRQCDSLLANIPVADCLFSDHFNLICDLTLEKPPLPKKKISFRKTNVVDGNLLCDELSITRLCTDSPDALNDLVKCYNSTLSGALDRHAPLVTKFITVRPLVPWFSEDIRESRRERRRAERKWRRSQCVRDWLEFKTKRNFTTYLMNEARRKFYSDFIVENSSNQRKLFSATKKLLNQGHDVPFPPTSDKLVLANEMGSFFVEKIDVIHAKLDRLADCLHDSHFDYMYGKTSPTRTLDSFIPLTESAVSELMAVLRRRAVGLIRCQHLW